MPLYKYLPFTSLNRGPALAGEAWDVEIHDDEFVGTASEVDGEYVGFRFSQEGDPNDPTGVKGSSCTASVIISQESEMSFVTALAGAEKGRFTMVVRRADSSEVYWAGVVHTDQVSYPDQHYPFHLEVFATDYLADLKDVDYRDDIGDPYVGQASLMEHVVNCIAKIPTLSIGTWPADRYRVTANWYSEHMDTADSPLPQALALHDRFIGKDRFGNDTVWSCYQVLDAIARRFNCRFYLEGGMFHFQQVALYHENTQKEFYYDETGTLTTTVSAANLDREVDYSTAGEMVKMAGGRYGFLAPLKEVCVDYHHVTAGNRGQGQNWGTADETYHTLPGVVLVDTAGETYIKASFRIRHRSNIVVIPSGSQPYPDHRLRFIFSMRMEDNANPGHYYYLKRSMSAFIPFYDIQPSEMEWFYDGANQFKIWSKPINDFDNNIEYEMVLGFTTPSLPVEVSGSKIEVKIDLDAAEKTNGGDITIDGVSLQGSLQWYTVPNGVSVTVEAEGTDSNPDNETIRTCATLDPTGNTESLTLDVYLGDGPAPYSLSALRVEHSGDDLATEGWKINGTGSGDGIPIDQLLAEQVLRFRKTPQRFYEGTFIHPDIRPYDRFVDDDKAYMAVSINFDAFENRWSGIFLMMDGTVSGITTGTPYIPDTKDPFHPNNPTGPSYPGIPPGLPDGPASPAPFIPPHDGLMGPVNGWTALAEQAPTKLRLNVLASDFNTSHELPVTAIGLAWCGKGDQISVINPMSGFRQTFTVAATPEPFDNVIAIKTSETMTKDFPYGSLVKLTAATAAQLHGWSHLERNVTGGLWEIPTSAGILPTVANYDAATIRQRVKLWRDGDWLIYDSDTYDNSFGIQNTDPQGIVLYFPASGADLYLEVR